MATRCTLINIPIMSGVLLSSNQTFFSRIFPNLVLQVWKIHTLELENGQNYIFWISFYVVTCSWRELPNIWGICISEKKVWLVKKLMDINATEFKSWSNITSVVSLLMRILTQHHSWYPALHSEETDIAWKMMVQLYRSVV